MKMAHMLDGETVNEKCVKLLASYIIYDVIHAILLFTELASSSMQKVLLMCVGIVIRKSLHRNKVLYCVSIINGMLVVVRLFKRLCCAVVYTAKSQYHICRHLELVCKVLA